MFWRVFSAALLLVSAVVVLGQDETPPVSPCPAVYGYGWNPVTGWHGQISINPPLQFSEVRLTVRLSLPYYRPEAGVGHVEIKGGDRAVQEISTKAIRGIRQTIRFLVIFPPFKQLPRITSVKINGREFCPAQQMYPDSRASIELKYTLKSGLDLPVDNGNSFSVTGSQPSRPAQPSQTGMKEEVIYVVQGNNGNAYIIPGSQLTRPTVPPTPPPAVVPPITAPTTLATPSTTPDVDDEYLAIIGAKPTQFISEEPEIEEPITSRPKPKPKPKPRPRPTPKPRSTTSTTTTASPDYEEVQTSEGDYSVNSNECGLPTISANTLVIKGEETEKGRWPWQVAMFKQSNTGLTFQCGGTLISKKHVITAAHCVYLKAKKKTVEADSILIYLGKHNLRSWTEDGQQAKDLERIIVHPEYGVKQYDFDLAVLILATPAEYSNYVKPVCLWDKPPTLDLVVNKAGSVLGWGKDELGGMANTLKLAKMPVVSQETCLRSHTSFYTTFTSDNTFCAGFKNGTTVCNGDSGGGMYFYLDNPKRNTKTWYTRGVVSTSMIDPAEDSCDDKSYVIFTDIAKLLPWIKSQLRPPST